MAQGDTKTKTVNRPGRQVLGIVHVAAAGIWLGCALAMLALALAASSPHGEQALGAWRSIAMLDRSVAAAGALLSIATGFVYCKWTAWGFLRHRWVAVKWLLALVVVVSGPLLVRQGVEGVIDSIQRGSSDAGVWHGWVLVVVVCLGGQVVALLLALILSRTKPWGSQRSPHQNRRSIAT